MYALEPRVSEPIFALIEDLIPGPPDHPLGCHRRRVPNQIIFRGLLLRLVTGAAWQTIEFMLGYQVSDTTLRARRDEWVDAGVFQHLAAHALWAYRDTIGFDLTNIFIDGCNNRALSGGPQTGMDPKNKGKNGYKFVLATDADGIPISFFLAGANRHDYPLMYHVLDDLKNRDLLKQVTTLHADRGFNYTSTPERLANEYQITDFAAPSRNQPHQGRTKRCPLGPRWKIERTNAWLRSNGQIANNTDRNPDHRNAALCLAITALIVHRITHPKHCTWRPIR